MDIAAHIARRYACWPLSAALALASLPSCGHAADAHLAIQAKPGEMVLLRNVPTRPAYRPATPGMALMVSPSPRPEVDAALGANELSDADYARLDASPSTASPVQATVVSRALHNLLARSSAGGNTLAGNRVGNTVAAPVGAIGDATRGIGDQVQGALAQLPFGNGH